MEEEIVEFPIQTTFNEEEMIGTIYEGDESNGLCNENN